MASLDVQSLIDPMVEVHKSGENLTLDWRLKQLQSLMRMVTENEQEFGKAIFKDLQKEFSEFCYSELIIVIKEIKQFQRELRGWMKPTQVSSMFVLAPCFCEVRQVPLSQPGCLIIGAFNYPFLLSLLPLIGSLGGGNPCILKPSELCPTISSLFAKLIPQYFDKGVVQVVEGGPNEINALMKEHWGMCLFTGSQRVGKIIQQAAAKTLTPTILELGGKCPTVIAEDCPDAMNVVCNRIISIKLMNCGQTCVSHDYILCHESKLSSFCNEAVIAIDRMYGSNPKTSELTRIVTRKHTQRLIELIEQVERTTRTGEKSSILCGGSKSCVLDEKYVAPTIVVNPPMDSTMMKDEIFGPILPILVYKTDEEALSIIESVNTNPLALCVFTKSKSRYEKFMAACPSGMAARNDGGVFMGISGFAFGGLGTSGIGSYKGKQSFEVFTHKKASMYHPCQPAFEFGGLRYHPHGNGFKSKFLLFAVKYLPSIPPIDRVLTLGTTVAAATAILTSHAFQSTLTIVSVLTLEFIESNFKRALWS